MNRTFTIDRFEGDVAVLETCTGEFLTIPRQSLSTHASEGDILMRVPRAACGESWAVLRAATNETRAEAQARLDRLAGRDPGGDLVL